MLVRVPMHLLGGHCNLLPAALHITAIISPKDHEMFRDFSYFKGGFVKVFYRLYLA